MGTCDYGCGNEAHYEMSNGKMCCEPHFNKCPAIRKKNSNGLKKAYREGRKDCSHWNGKRNWSKGKTCYSDNRIISNAKDGVFVRDSKQRTATIKRILITENIIPYECKLCGLGDAWNGRSLTLELDHINGDNRDHRLKNLRFLCPNCHSQTPTYKSKNGCGRQTPKVSDGELLKALKSSDNIFQALQKVGINIRTGYKRSYKLLAKNNIEMG